MCRANKTQRFSQISTGSVCHLESSRCKNNTKRDGIKRKSVSCWEVVNFKAAHRWKCARERKQHRRGSARASAHTKSSYLLTKTILCTMWKCVCACSLVCPDRTRCIVKLSCWGWGVNLSSARHIHQGTFSRGLCAFTPFLPPFCVLSCPPSVIWSLSVWLTLLSHPLFLYSSHL